MRSRSRKSSAPAFAFACSYFSAARAQLFAQERGEIGVRIGLEAGQLGLQLVARAGDILPEHAGPIELAAALARLSKLAIPAEIDERPFEPAVIARRDLLRPNDLFAELPRRPGVQAEGCRTDTQGLSDRSANSRSRCTSASMRRSRSNGGRCQSPSKSRH